MKYHISLYFQGIKIKYHLFYLSAAAPQQAPPQAPQKAPSPVKPAASSGSCQGIDVNLPNGADLAETDFLNTYTKTLVDLCEKDPDLYKTNDDCKQLDMTCRVSSLQDKR